MARKRIRSTLVCVNCRKKKMKCDRNLPCSSCVNAGIDLTCAYSSPTYKKPQFEKSLDLYSTTSIQNTFQTPVSEDNPVSIELSVNQRLESLRHKVKELEASIAAETPTKTHALTPVNDPTLSLQEHHVNRRSQNPIASEEDTISFLSSFKQPSKDKSRNISYPYRPLQFIFLLKRDPGAKIFFNYQMSLKNFSWRNSKSNACKHNVLCEQNLTKNSEVVPIDQKSRDFYGTSYISKIDHNYTYSDTIEAKNAISNYGINLGLTFCNNELGDRELIDKIKVVLPKSEIVSRLLDIFFPTLYPFFPFIDEASFRDDISKIVKNDMEGSKMESNILISKKKDLATICILLIVLRMSYLSIFSNFINQNDSVLNPQDKLVENCEERILMMNPVSLDSIEVAESCLKEFDLTANQDLLILQAATFMRIYRSYAPEEGSGYADGDLLVFNGILIHMANSLHLNRDPDYFLDRETDEKTKHLQRKLWFFLVNADMEDSITFGTPIWTMQDNYDTKLPFYCQNNSNLVDIDFERQVIKAFEYLTPVISNTHSILETILKVKSTPKISYVAKSLSELENLIDTRLGELNEHLVPDDSLPEFLKIMKLKLFIHCKLFLSYTYYCLHVYYEEKGIFDLHLFYLKKLAVIIFNDLAGISTTLLHSSRQSFGRAFTFIMTPVLEVFCRMEIVISLIILIRLQCTIRIVNNNHLEAIGLSEDSRDRCILNLQTLSLLFRKLADKSIEMVSIIGNRYRFAWRSKKAYTYILKLLFESSIYDNNEQDTRKAALKFSLNDQENIIELLESSINMKHSETGNHNTHIGLGKENKLEYLMNENQLENLWSHLESLRSKKNESSNYKNSHTTSNTDKIDSTDYSSENMIRDFDFFGSFSFGDSIPGYNPIFDMFPANS